MNKTLFLLFLAFALGLAFAESVPAGAAPSYGSNSSYPGYSTGFEIAPVGGNETQLDLAYSRQSLAWVGFYGNLSSIISLRDAAGSPFYAWTPATITGKVYASTSSSPSWADLGNDVSASTVDDLWGYGAASDNASSSFTANANTGFTVGTGSGAVTIAANTRDSLNTFSAGGIVPGVFEEILLSDSAAPAKGNLVFATLVNGLQSAYNSSQAHFQLLAPNNQVNETALDTYYFFVEIQ